MLGTVSQRKHAAIARAALTLFALDGYDRTSVSAIAAEAGVSKRTIYRHYGDKETLFLSVVRDTYERMRARVGEIVELTSWDRDLTAAISGCVAEITRSIVRAPDRVTLVRLLMAEAPHFPAVIDLLHTGEIASLIAAPLERLAAAGELSVSDPRQAAEHLAALTYGLVSNKSMMGMVPLSDDETARIIRGGVRAFLRAYAPAAQSAAGVPAGGVPVVGVPAAPAGEVCDRGVPAAGSPAGGSSGAEPPARGALATAAAAAPDPGAVTGADPGRVNTVPDRVAGAVPRPGFASAP